MKHSLRMFSMLLPWSCLGEKNERRRLLSFSGAQGGEFQIKMSSPLLLLRGSWHSLERESLTNQINACSVD